MSIKDRWRGPLVLDCRTINGKRQGLPVHLQHRLADLAGTTKQQPLIRKDRASFDYYVPLAKEGVADIAYNWNKNTQRNEYHIWEITKDAEPSRFARRCADRVLAKLRDRRNRRAETVPCDPLFPEVGSAGSQQ